MNIKLSLSTTPFGTLLGIVFISSVAYVIAKTLLVVLFAAPFGLLMYLRERNNGVTFTDDRIEIRSGVIFKKHKLYGYDDLEKLVIEHLLSTTAASKTVTLNFKNNSKFTMLTSETDKLHIIKESLRKSGIKVVDDLEPM